MGDAKDVMAALANKHGNITFPVLVPNQKGLEAALKAGVHQEIAIFGAASESFSQKNTNCSVAERYDMVLIITNWMRYGYFVMKSVIFFPSKRVYKLSSQ